MTLNDSINVSPAVIRRLPRYFRYLRILLREGKSRISSSELSERMQVTASQIRQDLNCFGGFGQQGYGYNISFLYAKICDLLGVSAGLRAVVIGGGNLGKAIVRSTMFEKRGVDVMAVFDTDPNLIGQIIADVPVESADKLEEVISDTHAEIAVLVVPKECAEETAKRCIKAGIKGIWNFTGAEMQEISSKVIVENVHLGDSLMTLCYNIIHDENVAKGEKT